MGSKVLENLQLTPSGMMSKMQTLKFRECVGSVSENLEGQSETLLKKMRTIKAF